MEEKEEQSSMATFDDDEDEEETLDDDDEEEQERQTSLTGEEMQSELADLAAESEMPIENLRMLYTNSTNLATVPLPKENQITPSDDDDDDDDDDEESIEQEDSGYKRLLIAEHPTTDGNGDEEDVDDPSFSFYWKKAINIGDQYQAVVPDLIPSIDHTNDQEPPGDQLLWCPPPSSSSSSASESNYDETSPLVMKYLKLAAKEHHTADQEIALEILLSTDYDIEQALHKLRLPTTNKNFYCPATWTVAECDLFEQHFKEFGKDFSMFKIPSRTIHELVFFYYIWKKTARHDVFVQQNRVEKRRFHLHPYVTDFLEKFFIEQDVQLANAYEQNNSSSSLTSAMGISGDQLLAKRRLSSELFLKPMPAVKRPKPLSSSTNPNDNDILGATKYQHLSPIVLLGDNQHTNLTLARSTSPTLAKKNSE